ncbi:MAG TPA: hypothetical protein VKM93_22015, partial [Terriglobia bacterium]|nr:hypothetical protein [Terriglobia bacterium]
MQEKTTTLEEVRSLLEARLRSAGLLPFVEPSHLQLLDFPEGTFVEIVLNDASKLGQVEALMADINEVLKKSGTELNSLVRALWAVERVQYVGPSRSLSGSLKSALDFRVTLRSGSVTSELIVELTAAAIDRLRQRMGIKSERVGWSNTNDDVSLDKLQVAVREFVELQLSYAGASSWDPVKNPHLELKEAVMSYLLKESPFFQLLRTAIDRFFGRSLLDSLENLRDRNLKIQDFQAVLPELSNYLGGAYRPGDRLATSAWTLYQSLDDQERDRIER